jgi:hypothetical protein
MDEGEAGENEAMNVQHRTANKKPVFFSIQHSMLNVEYSTVIFLRALVSGIKNARKL